MSEVCGGSRRKGGEVTAIRQHREEEEATTALASHITEYIHYIAPLNSLRHQGHSNTHTHTHTHTQADRHIHNSRGTSTCCLQASGPHLANSSSSTTTTISSSSSSLLHLVLVVNLLLSIGMRPSECHAPTTSNPRSSGCRCHQQRPRCIPTTLFRRARHSQPVWTSRSTHGRRKFLPNISKQRPCGKCNPAKVIIGRVSGC